MNNSLSSLILGFLVCTGLIIGGFFVGDGFYKAKKTERFVSVRGLAEREVPADLVVWPIVFKETGNDLSVIHKKIADNRGAIKQFLNASGFGAEEISESAPQITDFLAEQYSKGDVPANARYMAKASITLRTVNVEQAKKAMEKSVDLLSKGIVISQDYEQSIEYIFTSLNKIKPEMIVEATRNARKAAEQFARDSGSEVGSIKQAQQGLFTIENRDNNTPEFKKIRVVTTVDYYLAK